MKVEPDGEVEVRVIRSQCPLMIEGSSLFLEGAKLDYRRSGPVCVTALTGIYPWIMAARFRIESQKLGHDGSGYRVSCQDKLVDFLITGI